ncbi:hypothetical protein BH09VER1_BH09VER1_05760 [soil metagenome]
MRNLCVIAALALIIAVPFALKPKEDFLAKADDTLVIITPHNEQIRYEFTHAFSEYYKAKTGRSVRIDWRMPGGTAEIARYLSGEYNSAFKYYWENVLHKPWSSEASSTFDKGGAKTEARAAFMDSKVGINIDLFFGGGAYDFTQQAAAGRLVDCGILQQHPEWFTDAVIPHTVSGEIYYDDQARWIGTVLSSFGICYNSDSLRRLGVTEIPAAWSDLCNPKYLGQIALADPTKSGSAGKAFEMIIQQQMQILAGTNENPDQATLAQGWLNGLGIIQKAGANSRYFTDAAPKVPIDVSLGDAALGMCIDFYGRYQSEAVRIGTENSRIQYFTPAGGSSVGVDPIGLLRGAPNPEVAKMFIEFVLSMEGQKLWNFKVGTPGGPVKYALRRQPIRKELYTAEYQPFRSDPGVNPYEEARTFTYHSAWTGSLFKVMNFIIRVSCLDSHDEQATAWKALIAANFPPEATKTFSDMSAVSYENASQKIKPAMGSAIGEVILARELGEHFRAQYRAAAELARQGK